MTFLLELLFLGGAALVLGAAFARIGQSPLVGYLLAGMLIGPGGFGMVHAEEDIHALGELGVAALLFGLGLEFSWTRLRDYGRVRFRLGALQVAATLALAALAARAVGSSWPTALTVGAMLALSSTALVLRVLLDRGEEDAVAGRNAVAVLLVQDAAVVPLALLVTLLAEGGDAASFAVAAARTLGVAALFLVGLWTLLRTLGVAFLRSRALQRNRELATLLAVLVALGSAWGAQAVGTSPALGAFVAGMTLAASPFAVQVRADVASIRDLLLVLFFAAAGMAADPSWIGAHLPLLLGLTALVLAGKTFVVWALVRMLGGSHALGVATGLLLAQIGEFAFVIGEIGQRGGLLSDPVHQALTSTVLLSLLAAPYVIALAPRLAARIQDRFGEGPAAADAGWNAGAPSEPPDVVVIGFGPAGRRVVSSLAGDVRGVVVELNPEVVRDAAEYGFRVVVGDATSPEVLEEAGAPRARLVVITLPATSVALRVLELVRRMAPDATVVVRSRYRLHRGAFERAGAHRIVDEEGEVGGVLAGEVRAVLHGEETRGIGD